MSVFLSWWGTKAVIMNYELPLSWAYQLGQLALIQAIFSTSLGRYALYWDMESKWNSRPTEVRKRYDWVHLKPSSYLDLMSCPAAEGTLCLLWKAGLPLPPTQHPAGCSKTLGIRGLNLIQRYTSPTSSSIVQQMVSNTTESQLCTKHGKMLKTFLSKMIGDLFL